MRDRSRHRDQARQQDRHARIERGVVIKNLQRHTCGHGVEHLNNGVSQLVSAAVNNAEKIDIISALPVLWFA